MLEPLDALDVQMVGRLVEQQHVGPAQQQFGQLYAHAPPAAELTGGTVEVLAHEAQSQQRPFQLGVVVHAAHHLEALALVGEFLHECHVVLTVVIRPVGQFLIQAVQPLLHLTDVGKSLLGLLAHRALVAQHHHLGEVADGGIAGHRHRARSGLLQSGYDFQHGGLPGSVLSHEGNTVFVVNDIRNVLEQRGGAELHL